MHHPFSTRSDFRFLIPFLAPFVIGLLMLAVDLATVRAAQPSDSRFTAGDLGIATAFVSPETAVHTADGHGIGPGAVSDYIASLRQAYPGATFTTSEVRSVNSLLIVDWQGVVGGQVVFPGRTLVTIDDGMITDIWFLNLNEVAPIGDELPYEQGRPVVVEQDAS